MLIEIEDSNAINTIRSRGRLGSNEQAVMSRLYEKYINFRVKKHIDWTCPYCVKQVMVELVQFQEKATPYDPNENKQ